MPRIICAAGLQEVDSGAEEKAIKVNKVVHRCSYAPISWNTYPFLDLPPDGASAERENKHLDLDNFFLNFAVAGVVVHICLKGWAGTSFQN